MRSGRVLVLLFFFATSSTALAATKAIKFGKLVDGTGRVLTNAVIIVENDRVQSVATGNAAIPSGAEVIDLSRYAGIPGLIDAHTHITYYWDGMTTPRYEPPRHSAVTAFLAQENAQKALEAGVTTIRNLNSPDGTDLAMRDLINMDKMIGPRMFVSGLGIRITRSTAPPAPIGIMADGTDAVIHAVRQVIASGADWVKVYGRRTTPRPSITISTTWRTQRLSTISRRARKSGCSITFSAILKRRRKRFKPAYT